MQLVKQWMKTRAQPVNHGFYLHSATKEIFSWRNIMQNRRLSWCNLRFIMNHSRNNWGRCASGFENVIKCVSSNFIRKIFQCKTTKIKNRLWEMGHSLFRRTPSPFKKAWRTGAWAPPIAVLSMNSQWKVAVKNVKVPGKAVQLRMAWKHTRPFPIFGTPRM